MSETIFYDGRCALCHWTVQFVLKHDPAGTLFRFAPLQGATFQTAISPYNRDVLTDSIVVWQKAGWLLVRSDAIFYILQQIGGRWKVLAIALRVIPRIFRDWGYDFIAWSRYRTFGRRDDLCPIVSPELRERFLP